MPYYFPKVDDKRARSSKLDQVRGKLFKIGYTARFLRYCTTDVSMRSNCCISQLLVNFQSQNSKNQHTMKKYKQLQNIKSKEKKSEHRVLILVKVFFQ